MILRDVCQLVALDSAHILTVDRYRLDLVPLIGCEVDLHALPVFNREAAVGIRCAAVAGRNENGVRSAGLCGILVGVGRGAFGDGLVVRLNRAGLEVKSSRRPRR